MKKQFYIWVMVALFFTSYSLLQARFHFNLFTPKITSSSSYNTSPSNSAVYYYPAPTYYHSYCMHHACYDCYCPHTYGPVGPPKTIFGNIVHALAGTTFASVGTVFTGAGLYYGITQALLMGDEHYSPEFSPEDITAVRLQDGILGTACASLGILFMVIGGHELKQSLKRIYKLWKGLPLDDEDTNRAPNLLTN